MIYSVEQFIHSVNYFPVYLIKFFTCHISL